MGTHRYGALMLGAKRILLFSSLLLLAAPAVAGTLYRCDSADGSTAYVNTQVAGAKCRVVSHYSSPSHQRASSAPKGAGSVTTASIATASIATASIATASPASSDSLIGTSAPSTAIAPTPFKAPSSSKAPRLVNGQVYAYIKDGVRHYTSSRPTGGSVSALRTIKYSYIETCYACGVRPGVNFGNVRLNTAAYSAEISKAAQDYGVDEAIVRAIIHAESSFNPNALSRVGAQGLMQLMPATARRFGVGDPFNAAQNIRGGVEYLAWLLKRFNGNVTLAAAGYNAGEGAVDKYKGVPPYSETQRYVQRVGVLAERYRGTLAQR